MLIHPSGKLFNPQKSKAKTGRQETITPVPGLTARLNDNHRGEDQWNRDKCHQGNCKRFAINEVRLMP